MIDIPGYQISETLHQGGHYFVFRALKKEPFQQSMMIKMSSTPQTGGQADRLVHEFEMGQRIHSEYVLQYLALEPNADYGYLLIEEDHGAEPLIKHIPQTGFAALTFLNIAIQLAEGLQAIHQAGVIHQDIKPHNIFFSKA